MRYLALVLLCWLFGAVIAAPYELISKRRLYDHEREQHSKKSVCPSYLQRGQYEFPHYITQISATQPDKAFGQQYSGLFTPGDISTLYKFDVPASRAGENCTLKFIFPEQDQLSMSSFSYEGPGTFFFEGYDTGSCPDDMTTFNHQPAPSPFSPFAPIHMEPGYEYIVDVGPCSFSAGQCISGVTSTNDTNFSYFQDTSDCPIGIYIVYS
ncbi:GPI anchored cell wall protein [Astrocystis sublimbata]|nr:GPI anchored cell wall protein [Astrocystis sublimbata]